MILIPLKLSRTLASDVALLCEQALVVHRPGQYAVIGSDVSGIECGVVMF
jgi:hypothetical protein